MVRRSFFLTHPQLERLAAYARSLGVPAAEALRRILDAGLPSKSTRTTRTTRTTQTTQPIGD